MSTLSSAREMPRASASVFTLSGAMARLAGIVATGVEKLLARAELARSRRQLARLDERLLRDIGIDRATARFEADRGFWG